MQFERISINPAQMGGVPCIRGLRIPVATVVGLVAQGMPDTRIMEEYPDIEIEDIRESLRFAAANTVPWPEARRGILAAADRDAGTT